MVSKSSAMNYSKCWKRSVNFSKKFAFWRSVVAYIYVNTCIFLMGSSFYHYKVYLFSLESICLKVYFVCYRCSLLSYKDLSFIYGKTILQEMTGKLRHCWGMGSLRETSFSDSQFSSVQSLSHVRLFVTPWIAARQASLSITNSRSSLRLMSIESVMPSSHLILCRLLLFLPPIPPSLFQWVNPSHEVAKVLEFQL